MEEEFNNTPKGFQIHILYQYHLNTFYNIDCAFIDFDEKFPLDPPINDEDKRNAKIFKIMKECFEKGEVTSMKFKSIKELNLNVTKKHKEEAKKLYTEQISESKLTEEPDILHFLAARYLDNTS